MCTFFARVGQQDRSAGVYDASSVFTGVPLRQITLDGAKWILEHEFGAI
jgi:hypothetical protein